MAAVKAMEFISEISTPVDLSDRDSLLKSASTSLNSKVNILKAAFVFFSSSKLLLKFYLLKLLNSVLFIYYSCRVITL